MKDEGEFKAMALVARPNSSEGVSAILAVAASVILSAFILHPSSLLNYAAAGGLNELEQKVHFC